MKKLFIIDGAAGTGKTDMIEYIRQKYSSQATILSKYTTRLKRTEEIDKNCDLVFVSNNDFDNMKNNNKCDFYSYNYGDKENGFFKYGFYKESIVNALQEFEFVIIIVRNKQLIDRLLLDFKNIAFVVPVFIYTDRNLVIERLKTDGYSEKQIQFRLLRTDSCWQDYIENDYLDIPIIINNSNKLDFHREINQLFNMPRIIEKNNYLYINPNLKFELTRPLIGYKNILVEMLKKYPYEKNVFLMMKFRKDNYSTYEFIRDEINSYGFNCIRADQDEWQLTNTTFNPMAIIYCCKFGIALFDEAEEGIYYSPNVAYELGMMQTQSKDCLILINHELPSPPFDIVKDLYKSYDRESQLRNIIKSWLSKLI